MTDDERELLHAHIRVEIATSGQYAALVQDGQTPRVGYTVGLTEADLPEVVLAGGMALLAKPVLRTLKAAAVVSRAGRLADGGFLDLPGVGSLRAFAVHPSWARLLLGRARDFYARDDIPALQLVPDGDLRTVEVPDMSVAWDPEREPIWRWLVERWESDLPPDALVVCDLDALRGTPIAQAARWEDAQWQMFTATTGEVSPDLVRVVPLATLLTIDPSLEPVTRLRVGDAIVREPPGPWEPRLGR
jgi:hypothetical protein